MLNVDRLVETCSSRWCSVSFWLQCVRKEGVVVQGCLGKAFVIVEIHEQRLELLVAVLRCLFVTHQTVDGSEIVQSGENEQLREVSVGKSSIVLL